MSEQLHVVNPETCRGDGICADICPEKVLEIVDDKAATIASRAGACIKCGQCVAVCPTDSLRMPDLPDEDFRDLGKPSLGYDQFLDFLKQRRSVRVFKERPVEQDVLDKILTAAATTPMGFPPHSTAVTVINRREGLDFLLKQCVKGYDAMAKALSNPIGRAMVRLTAGAEGYHALKEKIIEVATHANEQYRRDGSDLYMRGAPLLMLFHGSRWALSYEENAHLVCHHAMLAALSLGLGSTIIGMIPPVVDRSKLLRERYGIPKENRVLTSLILGYPKYKYKKSIRRDLAGVRTV
jgi:ferredoxin